MSKKNLVEITKDKDTGEEHVKLNVTPEEVARAIFSNVKPPNPKPRKEGKRDEQRHRARYRRNNREC